MPQLMKLTLYSLISQVFWIVASETQDISGEENIADQYFMNNSNPSSGVGFAAEQDSSVGEVVPDFMPGDSAGCSKTSQISSNLENNHAGINPHEHPYHMVPPSPWPFLAAFSIGGFLLYFVLWLHGFHVVTCPFLDVLAWSGIIFIFSVISWLWDIVIEATFEGRHTFAVQRGLSWGFKLFLVSEAMFFFGFFWAFYYVSISPSLEIGAVWPPLGIKVINPWGLPLLNTVILLSSGITVTWAHKAMVYNNTSPMMSTASGKTELMYNARAEVFKGLGCTILLGIFFTSIQLFEYQHAVFSINDGIYGSVFYMLTGFHGFHVLVGTVFLLVCLARHLAYHFTRDSHLGFEFAIWYWHFVDIIWIFLYGFVYIWGG